MPYLGVNGTGKQPFLASKLTNKMCENVLRRNISSENGQLFESFYRF